MEARLTRLRSNFILLMVSISFVIGGQAWAQTSTLEYEKAKLVGKLAKYVTWPADARQSKFIIAVYEDTEKYEYFRDFFENKGINGKDIVVRFVKKVNEAKDLNIIYIPSNKRNILALANKYFRGSPVLMITEESRDLTKTMVDITYDERKSLLDLKVNDENIVGTKLIMPELSSFLDNNKDVELLTASPTFTLQSLHSKQLSVLKSQLVQQKSAVNQLNKQLNLGEENADKYSFILKQQTERFKAAREESTKKSQEIKNKDKKLKRLEKKLKDQQVQIKMGNQDFQIIDEDKIKEQEQAVLDLTEQLKQQKSLTNNAIIKITNLTNVNKSLSSFKMLFYVSGLITVIALFIAYLMWRKSKKVTSQPLSTVRENQLIKSENFAALGYIATDITYAVGLSLDDLQTQFESVDDTKSIKALKPVVTLLENFNLIAADQDDTEIQSFDVIVYLKKMMMLFDFEFNQSNIVYKYSGEKELTIKSVPSFIALVLLNLINNSLKHGFDNNGNGKITLKVEKGNNSGAKITYSDDGNGMSNTILEQVFNPFFTTRGDRGYVGVGMSTSYDLIKNKLAGDIQIESQESKGTTVTITLP